MDENCGVEYCNWWQMLLMIEDEFARSNSSGFKLIHPTPQKASHYTSLFRNSRFSDQMLAKWVEIGGIGGRAVHHLPNEIRSYFCNRGTQEFVQKLDKKTPRRPASATPSRPSTANEKGEEQIRRPSSAVRSRIRHTVGSSTAAIPSMNEYLSSRTSDLNTIIKNISDRNELGPMFVKSQHTMQSNESNNIKQKASKDWSLISRINRNIVLPQTISSSR